MRSIASELSAELGPEPQQKRSKQNSGRRNGERSVFDLANEVDTVSILDRLGITHESTPRGEMAVCPGCSNDGALVGDNGGLKCLHATCAPEGVPSKEGYRLNVDLVALVNSLEPLEAARQICDWFGIEVPKRANAEPATVHDDEPPPGYDTEAGLIPTEDAPPEDQKPEQREPSPIEQRWLTLADSSDWLTQEPPPQRWLLTRWHNQRDHGVFPRGRTGILNATGGTGKTYTLIQLALAVASGGFWFDTFRVAEPGHVCLALGEEDADEARRRLWRACNALQMTPDQRRAVAGRLHLLPLAGLPVALTRSMERVIVETETADELRGQLNARGVDWSLVILDPLSRWAGGGVEADNEAATRFCQVVESLTAVQGNPSVLVAHHSSKLSAKDGSADSRGVSGIRDGFRWQVALDPVTTEDGLRGVLLRNKKSNYSLEFPDIALVRSTEPGTEGTLRLANRDESERLGKSAGGPVSEDEYQQRVLATVGSRPGLKTASEIQALTKGRKRDVLDAIKALRLAGRLEDTEDGFRVVPEGSGGTA